MRRLAIILLIFSAACVERYEPEYQTPIFTDQLVVEGTIKQNEAVHEIALTRSIPIGSEETFSPESFAQLMLFDEEGNCYEFTEDFRDRPGVYKLDSALVDLESNKSYQLKIILEKGEVYLSDFQRVPEMPVFSNLEMQLAKDDYYYLGQVQEGEVMRAYASIQVPDEPMYYRFDYNGVYAFRVPFQGSSNCRPGITTQVNMQEVYPLICYRFDDKVPRLNILSTADVEANTSLNTELFQIESDNKFAFGYDMDIYVYAINNSYYEFLRQVREQVQKEGSLFDTPPTLIKGNIQSELEPIKDALGFFTIEAASRREVFIDSLFFEEAIIDPLNEFNCQHDLEDPDLAEGIPRQAPPPFCCDCRLAEGAIEEPEGFWPEK